MFCFIFVSCHNNHKQPKGYSLGEAPALSRVNPIGRGAKDYVALTLYTRPLDGISLTMHGGGLGGFGVTPLVGGVDFQMHHINSPIWPMVASPLVLLSSRLSSGLKVGSSW